jgi:ubiquitin C-terminal hydrolase
VSLAIPLRRQDWSLEDSLQEFTIEETVTGVECPDCYTKRTKAKKSPNQFTALPPRTGVRQTARKRLTFTRAPKVLCLHLRRLVRAPSGEPVKSNCHVRFPLELDLTPYCSFGCGPEPPSAFIRRKTPVEVSKEQEVDDTVWQFVNRPRFGTVTLPPQLSLSGGSNSSQAEADLHRAKKKMEMTHEKPKQSTSPFSTLYRLVSVIVHHGSHLGGHYAVYRKLLTKPLRDPSQYPEIGSSAGTEDWVYISDESVQPCSVAEVLKAQAYMLFYEKY